MNLKPVPGGKKKPEPIGFLQIPSEEGLPPEECIHAPVHVPMSDLREMCKEGLGWSAEAIATWSKDENPGERLLELFCRTAMATNQLMADLDRYGRIILSLQKRITELEGKKTQLILPGRG